MSRKLVLIMILTIVLIAMFGVALKVERVEAGGTITIKADGSVEGTTYITSDDNVTYTFTDNIYDEIVVERSNITIDGNGYTLQGTGAYPSKGIDLSDRSNVTIKNTEIKLFDDGILLSRSSNNTISGNTISTYNWNGITLYESSNNSISGNNITKNGVGIWLHWSSNNSISGNNIANNSLGIMLRRSSNNSISGNNIANNRDRIWLSESSDNSILANTFLNDGLFVQRSYGSVVEDNVVNGKPLVYLEGVTDNRVEDAGQVILVNCDGMVVENLNLSNTAVGVQLWNTNNTKIANNIVANNEYSIWLQWSSNNSISGNNIANNYYGIRLEHSSNYSISGNNIANNRYGIWLDESSYNVVYHNNFINNTQPVYSYGSVNVWDDGAGKGNYWSDYEERYPNATEIDGIWDTPYEIDDYNQDNYPLMNPWTPKEENPFWMLWWLWTIVAVVIVALAGAVYVLKKRKSPTPTAPPPPAEGTLQNIHCTYSCHSHLQTKNY